jgi:hypothetical protein
MGSRRSSGRKGSGPRHWSKLNDQQLLDRRLCDLDLGLEGTALEARVERLQAELAAKGLGFRPYVWLSSDWFTPDGLTGFAVPFFLAHRRLARLERHQMLEVEGGTNDWCMKLLRHEAAHAIDNAYRLHWRKGWRQVFGRFSEPYRSSYAPDPRSRQFVHNLDYWYSQSHPAEDYAETFAVWLDPASRWERRYAGWPALDKLRFIDGLMAGLATEKPRVRTRRQLEPVSKLSLTLGDYYRAKRAVYDQESVSPGLDDRLVALFVRGGNRGGAAAFLRKNERRLHLSVARATGQHRYLIDHVLRGMILRCRALRLQLNTHERDTLPDAAALLTSLTMQFLYGGHPRYHR